MLSLEKLLRLYLRSRTASGVTERRSLAIRLLSILWLRDLSPRLPFRDKCFGRPRSTGLDSRRLLLVFLSRVNSRDRERGRSTEELE